MEFIARKKHIKTLNSLIRSYLRVLKSNIIFLQTPIRPIQRFTMVFRFRFSACESKEIFMNIILEEDMDRSMPHRCFTELCNKSY